MPETSDNALPVMPPLVREVFDTLPAPVRHRLEEVRAMIFAAAADAGAGPLTETLKWGEPAYLTEATGSGSTIRLGQVGDAPGHAAVFVNCRTALADTFRTRLPALSLRDDRAVLVPLDNCEGDPDLGRALTLALTYHRWK